MSRLQQGSKDLLLILLWTNSAQREMSYLSLLSCKILPLWDEPRSWDTGWEANPAVSLLCWGWRRRRYWLCQPVCIDLTHKTWLLCARITSTSAMQLYCCCLCSAVFPEAVWISSFTAVSNCFMLLIASCPWQALWILTVNDREETGPSVHCRLFLSLLCTNPKHTTQHRGGFRAEGLRL